MSGTLADNAIEAITSRASTMATQQDQNAPQFDWSALILPAFDLLSQLLTSCISKTSSKAVNEKLKQPGFYRSRRIWQAIRAAEKQNGQQLTGAQRWIAFRAIRDELDATDPDVTTELLDELQADEAAADWSILG